jgi:hypothetical protein
VARFTFQQLYLRGKDSISHTKYTLKSTSGTQYENTDVTVSGKGPRAGFSNYDHEFSA